MKLAFTLSAAAALLSSTTHAFTAKLNSQTAPRSTALRATKEDYSDLITEAMNISKKFGATSAEARLAWEAVEEVSASDNRYVLLLFRKRVAVC